MIDIQGIKIPIKSLTNHELNKYADILNIRSFRGTYMRNALPKQLNATESAIVNLDDASGPGTHWVCYYKTPSESFYFDSFGLEPPDELTNYLNRPLHYSTNEIQERGSVICGHLCLHVLKELSQGKTFREIIYCLI